jgi:hypothetical protein
MAYNRFWARAVTAQAAMFVMFKINLWNIILGLRIQQLQCKMENCFKLYHRGAPAWLEPHSPSRISSKNLQTTELIAVQGREQTSSATFFNPDRAVHKFPHRGQRGAYSISREPSWVQWGERWGGGGGKGHEFDKAVVVCALPRISGNNHSICTEFAFNLFADRANSHGN